MTTNGFFGIFSPEIEMTKALSIIKNDATNDSITVSEADERIRSLFQNDKSANGGGWFVAIIKKNGVKMEGFRCVPFNGYTLLSTFCTPDVVKNAYKEVKYNKVAKMGVVLYSTPKRLEIISEQI